MRVVLTRSGGFAGLRQAASVDEEALAPDERQELRRLVEHAGLRSLAAGPSAPSPAADRFRYRITAEDGDRRWEIRISEETLSAGLRDLVRWLEQRLASHGS